MKKKKKKKVLTEEEKQKIIVNRQNRAFKLKIRNMFTNSGFKYLKSENKHFTIDGRDIELDSIFMFNNIMLISEETGRKNKIKDHIRTKNEAFSVINNNKEKYLEWLIKTFPEYENDLNVFYSGKMFIFFLYFTQNELPLTDEERKYYSLIKFIEPPVLNYFSKIAQCIKLSARYEIFKFLGLKRDDIGDASSSGNKKTVKTSIIYPRNSTGKFYGVRVVSFMLSADALIRMSYVMRKDNWEDSVWLYQRLMDSKKINNIRSFIAENGQCFYNNIIVGLPNNISFCNSNGKTVDIDDLRDFENCILEIPDEINSICIIDGQHRIYAHYEGNSTDKYEEKIKPLREKLHLLVTGLIFPDEMPDSERAKIQSTIFLDINSNAKPVPPDVLLHIAMVKDPLSDVGLARRVLEKLNKKECFLNMFEFSLIDAGKIKIASIIKFALRYLVTINPQEGKKSLINYWKGDIHRLKKGNQREYEEYIEFCSSCLDTYFTSLKTIYASDWNSQESKLLSVISLNGFILAYLGQLPVNGIKNSEFYINSFKNLNIDFSNKNFIYTSSQYRKLSIEILRKVFNIELD